MGSGALEISPDAVNLLKRDVIHAYKSIPRRGAETGGLLCGTLKPSLRIARVVPVPIEYRLGPAYRLSDDDKRKFQDAIAANDDVIGWYRSHTRVADGLTEEDRETASRFFAGRQSAFLICFPDARYNVNGRLHLWKDGKKEQATELPLGRFSLLEDALQSAEKAEEPNETRSEALNQELTPAPTPLFAPAFATTVAPRKHLSPALRAAMIGGIALAALGGTALLLRSQFAYSSNATVHANNFGLGMKVGRQGKALLINWDRQSAAVLEATDANFTINEGVRSKVLRLSASELHSGGILYTPQSGDDVQVELSLHGPGGNFAQSLRIVQADSPTP